MTPTTRKDERHARMLDIVDNIRRLSKATVDDIVLEYMGSGSNCDSCGKALITFHAESMRMLEAASRFQEAVESIPIDEETVRRSCPDAQH